MKIVIDRAIPFINGIFEPYSEVIYLQGQEFTPNIVKDADALIIRTRTRCDERLLRGSNVRHIATATIGYDHIDLKYCQQHGITVTTAQGCNARGVLQWVGASLSLISQREGWQPHDRHIGIVGVGSVGRLIKEYATAWGFEVVCCDPPRKEKEGLAEFVSFEELLKKVDIVTFHTPLNESTYHMLNSQSIKALKPTAVIINSSRGEVVESEAVRDNPRHALLFDVWENEPNIDPVLLDRSIVSTPHIAGYSLQGKANGTAIVVRDVALHFGLPIIDWYPDVEHNKGAMIKWIEMQRTIKQHLDIEQESKELKQRAEAFESLRNNYNYRREYF